MGVLIDALHGFLGDALGCLDVALERPVAIRSGNPAQRDHGAEAAHGVGAAAEAEQENAIVGPAIADQGGVAIDDVAGEAEAGCLADQVVEEVPGRAEHAARAFAGADAGIVERVLLGRIDRGIGPASRRAVQLVDVAAALVEQHAAALAGAIGIDHDVSWHGRLPGRGSLIYQKLTTGEIRRRGARSQNAPARRQGLADGGRGEQQADPRQSKGIREPYEHPLVEPQVVHFMHVPFRTRVKLPHSPQASPS